MKTFRSSHTAAMPTSIMGGLLFLRPMPESRIHYRIQGPWLYFFLWIKVIEMLVKLSCKGVKFVLNLHLCIFTAGFLLNFFGNLQIIVYFLNQRHYTNDKIQCKTSVQIFFCITFGRWFLLCFLLRIHTCIIMIFLSFRIVVNRCLIIGICRWRGRGCDSFAISAIACGRFVSYTWDS